MEIIVRFSIPNVYCKCSYNKKVVGTIYNAHTCMNLSGHPCTSLVSRPEVEKKRPGFSHLRMHISITDHYEHIHQWEGASDALVSHEEVPING